jgi:hypothetical protein
MHFSPVTGLLFLFVKPTLNEDLKMKKFVLALTIAGSAMTLAACDTTGTGNVETAAPYETERTASHDNSAPAPQAERVFRSSQSK